MTDLELLKHARHTAAAYRREAAQQRLARAAVRAHPTYGLGRVYYLSKALFWFATALPAALSVLLLQSRGFRGLVRRRSRARRTGNRPSTPVRQGRER